MRAKLFLAAMLALLPTVSSASETIIYNYDANGRLVVADSRRPGQGGLRTRYRFDAADNRALATGSGPYTLVTFAPNTAFARGQAVMSADGRFLFTFQDDGDVVLLDQTGAAIWHTATAGTGATQLSMQGDGNLVIYAGQNAVWASGTGGHWGAFLNVQSDGNAVIYNSYQDGGGPIWATDTCCR